VAKGYDNLSLSLSLNLNLNLSDVDLVRAVGSGDRDAYGVLVDRHLKSVYAVALRIVCNTAAAQDVSQDVFVRAYERLYLYDMNHPFRNWLLKITTNVALNHLRSRQRERILHLRASEVRGDPEEPPEVTSEVPGPREWRHWLGQLDEAQRAAIVLFHFHEMPYAEIADVLDVPVNTVRTYLHRGRRRLRELMTAGSGSENGSWNVARRNG
jgi:RNA polymerase sigma-70 factor (ECF subfamily)